MLRHVLISYSHHPQGARSFLVKVTEFKITKNIKGPLWKCGRIRLVCMYGVLCGDVKLDCFQLTSPQRTPYIHTKRMLPHCHNGPYILLVILNSVTLTRKLRAP
jgi:hypothetical protein